MQGDILAPYLFILCQDYVLWMSIALIKENGFTLEKQEADDISQKLWQMQTTQMMLLANTPAQAESQLCCLEQAVGGIGLYMNANKIDFMYF